MQLTPGTLIGQYVVERQLGAGGMGVVYQANQPAMNRSVAIKVLLGSTVNDADSLARFRREAGLIAQLEHPHILPLYDYGQYDGSPYVVMRYLAGGSLQERLQAGSVSRPELLRYLTQVAAALDYAHQRGVVHRDVKPANVLFDRQQNAYLTDFGIAKEISGAQDLTATGSIVGTPAYMSPEQARGERLDGRSDIYSLALIAYQALAGRLPFSGQTAWEIIQQHVSAPVPSVRLGTPELSPLVDGVLQRALAKDRSDRPGRAGEFVAALTAAVEARAQAPATIRAAAQETIVAPPPAAPTAGRGGRWFWLVSGVLGLGLLLLLALGGALFLGRQAAEPAVTTYPSGDSPRALAYDGESLWVALFFDNQLARVAARDCRAADDPCGRLEAAVSVPDLPVAVAPDGDTIWVASALDGVVTGLNRTDGAVRVQVSLPHLPAQLLVAGERLWAVSTFGNRLMEITRDGQLVDTYGLGQAPFGLVAVGESLWIANQDDMSVSRFDLNTRQVTATYTLSGRPGALAHDGQRLWVALEEANAVVALDPGDGGQQDRVAVGERPVALLFDGQFLWTANAGDNSVSQIDPAAGRLSRTITVPGGPFALAWVPCGPDCGDLWVAGQDGDSLSRLRRP